MAQKLIQSCQVDQIVRYWMVNRRERYRQVHCREVPRSFEVAEGNQMMLVDLAQVLMILMAQAMLCIVVCLNLAEDLENCSACFLLASLDWIAGKLDQSQSYQRC